MKKKIAYCFIFIANTILLFHAIIPHKHPDHSTSLADLNSSNIIEQNNQLIHFHTHSHNHESSKTHNHDNHEEKSTNCHLNQPIVLTSQHSKNLIDLIDYSDNISPDYIFLHTNDIIVDKLDYVILRLREHPKILIDFQIETSLRLRAPPAV